MGKDELKGIEQSPLVEKGNEAKEDAESVHCKHHLGGGNARRLVKKF
jgi:hypothetical protein